MSSEISFLLDFDLWRIYRNLIAFYYGDLAHPSNDPPRIGFLSTVPTTAASALSADIAGAVSTGIQGESMR